MRSLCSNVRMKGFRPMRILLDESLPKDLASLLLQHEVTTVHAAGWSGIKNGKLLALAAASYDVFITADRNLEHQPTSPHCPSL